jgi:hypothetical protein
MNIDSISRLLNNERISFQIRTDILDVYFDLRKGARIICRLQDELESIVNDLIVLNLSISVGKGLVAINSNNYVFEDYFKTTNASHERGVPLYIAKDQKSADNLRSADEEGNDFEFGKLLSYPSCCIEAVVKNNHVPSVIDALSYLVIDSQYNVWCWPVASIADASLLSHFPCSFHCKNSQNLAFKRFQYIRSFASLNLLEKIIKMHSVEYYKENNQVRFSTTSNSVFIRPNLTINEF